MFAPGDEEIRLPANLYSGHGAMGLGFHEFLKLKKWMVLSTATGDFFEVPEAVFKTLEQCRKDGCSTLSEGLARFGRNLDKRTVADLLAAFPETVSSPPDEAIGVSLSDLTLNLTSRCNLACIYCWNDRGTYSSHAFSVLSDSQTSDIGRQVATVPAACEMMSIEIARRAVDDLIRHRGTEQHLVVDFYGGEPLLNLPVMEQIIAYCRGIEEEAEVSFRFLIATNGTLLTPAVAEKLIHSGVEIAVSIDGRAEVQNHNRPFAGGGQSFEVVRRNLDKMPDRLRKLLVGRATITPAFPDMVAAYGDLRNLGFERIELFESEDACHRVSPNRAAVFFHRPDQYERLIAEWERLAVVYTDEVKNGHLNHYNTFFNRFFKLMQKLYHHHELSGGCPAGRGQIAVSCDGGYYPCTAFIGVDEFLVGHTASGLDMARLERFLLAADKRGEHCSPCEFFSLCKSAGSCLNLNLYYNGDIAKPCEQGCRLFKNKMELAMAVLAILSQECPELLERLFGVDPSGARGSYPVGTER